jgi:beta-mannosidase
MWPAISWAVKDSAGSRKLSWYAMREAYRPRLLHFSGENRALVIVNDTAQVWRDQLYLITLDELGNILETKNQAIEVAAHSKHTITMRGFIPEQGYVVAQLGDIRTSRSVSDKPVAVLNKVDAELTAELNGYCVEVTIRSHSFVFEFSLLPELVAHEVVSVSAQRLTILPNERKSIEIFASTIEDAQLIHASIKDIAWSLNRLVGSPAK